MGRQASWLILSMLVGAAAFWAMMRPAHADPAADARFLHCVKSENARPLVDVALTLGLASRGADDDRLTPRRPGAGRDLTIAQWRRDFPRDFDRACGALVASLNIPKASSGSRNGLVEALTQLVPVTAGAVLALLSASVTARRAAAERTAGALHAATAAYVRACRACLVAWRRGEGRGLEADMERPRDDLAAEVKRCGSRHPGWRLPRLLLPAIEEFDRALKEANWPSDPAELTSTANGFLDRLERLHRDLTTLVAALDRPLHHYFTVRRKGLERLP